MELGLGGSADVASESSVRNAISVLEHVLQILDGSLELESLDGSSSLVGVLEVSSEIVNSGLGRYTKRQRLIHPHSRPKVRSIKRKRHHNDPYI